MDDLKQSNRHLISAEVVREGFLEEEWLMRSVKIWQSVSRKKESAYKHSEVTHCSVC
jgi:hypothetical protein